MTIEFNFGRSHQLVKAHCLVENIDMDEFAMRIAERTGRESLTGAAVKSWLYGTRGMNLEDAAAIADELEKPMSEVFPRLNTAGDAA